MATVTATPTPQTPAEWAARIVIRHPALAAPVAKALALVESGHVHTDSGEVEVKGSDGQNTYHLRYVAETGSWLCNCPAFLYRPLMIGQTAYCKHTLAVRIAARAGLVKEN